MFSAHQNRSRAAKPILLLVMVTTALLVAATPGSAQGRTGRSARSTRPTPQTSVTGGLVTHDLATGGETPASLVQSLVGPGAVVTNIQYTGAPIAAGTFSGGTGIIGFEQGIILSSGDIALVVGPENVNDGTSTSNHTPGDADLDAVLGSGTRDAAILEFDLECSAGNAISFQYVFSSDEYDEYVSVVSNDVFGCFLNGQNIAGIPGTHSPIAIQSVNCGHDYDPPSGGVNCAYYMTNDCISLGLGYPCSNIATEMDGLTVVLTATGLLQPGANHIKLAIADNPDDQYDSNVFIRGQSFVCSLGVPMFEAPSPCGDTFDVFAGEALSFEVKASATNGLPAASVSLDVTGDTVPLAGGAFTPPLPAGPAQPVSSVFQWTPGEADIGFYHLTFTATDQLQQATPCEVAIRVSAAPAPVFEAPSPCGNTLNVNAWELLSFEIQASATNGLPAESVSLDVTGDAVPLAGGTFTPPMPAGPAQPVSSVFQWTPGPAEIGLYHLMFTATDQLQQSVSCGVSIRVTLPIPEFESTSPCGHFVNANAGLPFSFGISASATNGFPGQSVTLSVTGDAIPLAGGSFVPPLPAGPAQPVASQFQWTPTLADIGIYHLDFTATDQLQLSASCGVTIRVVDLPGIDLCQAGMGVVIPCPCGNPPATSPGGCDNSSGTGGARLESIGGAFINGDSLVFTTTGENSTALGIVLQGNVFLSTGVMYGQGVRCVGGLLKRMYVKTASGGSITAPQIGDPPVSVRSAQRGDIITPGTTRYYAVYYRDPTILGGCPATSTFNVTQTQGIRWAP